MAPSRRAPAGTATPSSEVDRVLTSHSLDLRAARSRVELVAEALELPFAEVESAMADPEGHSLLAFACQYGQNIDWLVLGDLSGVVRECWRRHGAAPDMRLPA
ncbi:MAG TPA: hypothetical protein VEW06_05070 [Xanthobacteraceae bacterium]|nr:hypothetical protein [Xanthobacteraceae bacterium]